MPVTTRAQKRANRENCTPNKRVCESKPKKKGKATGKKTRCKVPDVASGAKVRTTARSSFPARNPRVVTCSHAIVKFAMNPPLEAFAKAVEGGDYESLEELTDMFGCSVADALEYAAENGFSVAVRTLLPEIIGDEEFNLDDQVRIDLERMAVTAAGNGHCEVVSHLLFEIQQERQDEHRGEFVYYGYENDIEERKNDAAWHVLEAAAESGHADVVEVAAGGATDDEFYFPASGPCRPRFPVNTLML